jgi:Glycosyltransferase Family 4
MRILVCSAYFESHRGGIEFVAGQLAREYCSLGHSVSWLAADASNPPSGASAAGRVVPLRASNVSERWLHLPQALPGLSAFRIIKREVARADVVHLHDAPYLVHLLALMLARAIAASIRLRPARHGVAHNG